MPEMREEDLLAIMSAGAYGFVMASSYNSRPLPAEALVRGDKVSLIRRRQTWEDLVRERSQTAVAAARWAARRRCLDALGLLRTVKRMPLAQLRAARK